MKYSYPKSHDLQTLTRAQLCLKIARHSPCSVCTTCKGLHPAPNVQVVLDDSQEPPLLGDLGQYGSDDDDLPTYLDSCGCGHGVLEHGANEHEIGPEEFRRRSTETQEARLLQDVNKLLDFEYSDADIASLRKRMTLSFSAMGPPTNDIPHDTPSKSPPLSPTSSILSDLDAPPPNKRRRISFSSGSEDARDAQGAQALLDDDDDDEEDRPLAMRMRMAEKTASKAAISKTSKTSKKVPASRIPASSLPVNGRNGATEVESTKIKVEDKLDDTQLDRLATGVPVDSVESSGPPVKTEKAAITELRNGIITITAVENDKHPRSLVILTGLKTLFQKQLPKMPREYIARLVYDSNSKSLAIIKRGYKVVGGICYRPFPQRGFAEIVFFATASVDQVKGYGGMLMDHFKMHIRKAYPNMWHFLTYADNYAVGYFEKQGFSKDITLDRSVWAGYIKDYEGGTIMQCTMLRKVDYLDKANITNVQQEAIMAKIRQMSRSHIVHPGLPQFQEGAPADLVVEPKDVPGLRESGWSPEMAERSILRSSLLALRLTRLIANTSLRRTIPKSGDRLFMEHTLREMQNHNQAWPFLKAVSAEDVPDYLTFIKEPMDFGTMEHKLDNNQYTTVEDFVRDAHLVFDNCRLYNEEGSIYHKCANALEKFLREQLKERVKRES
ncbi:histone acetyltransferase [Marasmius crinis-equi]|uniref:histone acetyltransferase n=1 Tax=Marasmius crinis-equi TaxID=585013 RepID=A0ABR3FUJ7_9AGAR